MLEGGDSHLPTTFMTCTDITFEAVIFWSTVNATRKLLEGKEAALGIPDVDHDVASQ